MNCPVLQQLWDAYRDAPDTLAPAERAACAAHLRQCPDCAALWRAEGAWLTELSAADPQALPSVGRFRGAVLNQWDAQTSARDPGAPSPDWLARLSLGAFRGRGHGRGSGLGVFRLTAWSSLAAAAAIAFAVLIATPKVGSPTRVARGPAFPGGRAMAGVDPIAQAVKALRHADIPSPARVLDGLKATGAELALEVRESVAPGDTKVPDPLADVDFDAVLDVDAPHG